MDTVESSAAIVRTTSRKTAKYIKWALLLAGTVWFARFAYLRITLRPTPRPEYWAAQIAAIDPPRPNALSAIDADKILNDHSWEPPIPATAPHSYQVYEPHDLLSGDWDRGRVDVQHYDPAFRSVKFEVTREKLQHALATGWFPDSCLNPNSGFGPTWDEWRWGRTLIAHSRWVRETTHNMRQVLEDWQMTLQLSRQLSRTRTFAGEFVRSRIEDCVAREVLLTARELHVAIDARAVSDVWGEIRPSSRIPSQCLEGERYYDNAMLENGFVREGGSWLDLSECKYTRMQLGSFSAPSRIWNLASPLFHDLNTARQRVDRKCEFVRTLSSFEICSRVEENWSEVPSDCGSDVLDGYVSGLPLHYLRLSYAASTLAESAMAAHAITEFRREHGHFPDSLDVLVPQYLNHVPIDYVDLKPLRYRRLPGDDYLLYSIGVDGKDNGGVIGKKFEKRPDSFYAGNTDAVFSLVRRAEQYK